MSKRARDRQLAKLAARRQAERRAAKRRRDVLLGVGGTLVAAALVVTGVSILRGEPGDQAASPSASASPSPEPGTRTGTVQPGTAAAQVACGGTKPAAADRPKPQFAAPATVVDRQDEVEVTLVTSCGDIVLELDAKRAPQTVNSFVFLARRHYFDGTFVHRLDESIDVIQAGDPEGTGGGGPGYTIPDELKGNETYGPGTVAMANAGPGTGGSQFFLIAGPDGHNLDGNPDYTIFGSVVQGMDVASRIMRIPIQDPDAAAAGDLTGQAPAKAIYIEEVDVRVTSPPAASAAPTASPSPSA